MEDLNNRKLSNAILISKVAIAVVVLLALANSYLIVNSYLPSVVAQASDMSPEKFGAYMEEVVLNVIVEANLWVFISISISLGLIILCSRMKRIFDKK